MKKFAKNTVLCMQLVPQTIVFCRDQEGRNNALVVGFTANISLDPVMVMVGIVPTRFSHHMVKETGCFVINLPKKDFQKECNYLFPGYKTAPGACGWSSYDWGRALRPLDALEQTISQSSLCYLHIIFFFYAV